MSTSKVSVAVSTIIGKILSIIGYTTAVIGAIVVLVSLYDGDTDGAIAVAIVFLIPALPFIIGGARIKRRIKRFRIYVSLIASGNTALEAIAAHTSRPLAFVRNDILKMISKRYFTNAFIDHRTNTVVVNRPVHPPGGFQPFNSNLPPPVVPVSPPPQGGGGFQIMHDEYTCGGCGSSGTKQRGAVITCEYCGSGIK
ncbi:MAG: hypothetical protein FWE42_03695 [Defluviitaleaceae bacterium]|nr:hypothetical protein [Defluviitaleaceae bacterium]